MSKVKKSDGDIVGIPNKNYPAPLPVQNLQLPIQVIAAYSDINMLNAFIVRESRKLGWASCAIPNATGGILHENGISFDGDAHAILGILYDYFKIKAREKESREQKPIIHDEYI